MVLKELARSHFTSRFDVYIDVAICSIINFMKQCFAGSSAFTLSFLFQKGANQFVSHFKAR